MKLARIRYQDTEHYGVIIDYKFQVNSKIKRNNLGIEDFTVLREDPEEYDKEIDINDEDITWLTPVARPSKIICVGRNYLKHSEEQGEQIESKPILFSKYMSSLSGHKSQITFPKIGNYLDYEVELAVVIGKSTNNLTSSKNPLDYILGYTVANDLTLRDIQKSEKQWTRGKAFDNSLPLGPYIETELNGYKDREIWLTLNGDKRQLSNTSNMIFDVEYLISYISQLITLSPGDIILTGTPEGVGYYMDPKATLKPGDVINCGIIGLAELSFSIKEQ